ncbi:permease for cytosine/purines, uracil, thiamine, allantoin-domain-containing protein [Stachybotrys elegans]|uniref:Permease for cytosine/purines, uracil, thiamine, allantoin-domain-containing protein n=1 Tax=Stachybotrys elegans TaxID=80388 RepID=A0A8K0SH83_9HYPO|nr:permease for cytosine/purines, uracil, thiamine, allantoin-domain-containing protein [Stachybotrys elegans]
MAVFNLRPRVPRTFRSLRVNDGVEGSKWANEDVLPIPEHKLSFGWQAYFGYWCAVGFNTTTWSLCSSNLAAGLDAGGAMGGIFVGTVLAFFVAVVCGEPGLRYHLGFPMMGRATFGMYGSWFVIILKCFVNVVFFGFQSYWGGLAADVVLSSIFPSFQNLANTLPESAAITTKQLVGFVCYILVFTPLMFIHPTKLQPFLFSSQILVNCTMASLFIWAMARNGGATFLPPAVEISSSTRSFLILQAMSSVAGSWTGACIRQSDWTRMSKSRAAVLWNQGVTGIIAANVCALLGIATTSAVSHMYGTPIWNPINLLLFLQENNYDAATRAGTFFAGFGFFSSQVTINLVQNSVSCGMDLAALAPKWIDVTRGSLIMCLIGYLIQPWRFVNSPGIFISVLVSFGMFVSPLAGINFVDFWVVRRRNWKVPDLYKGGKESIYWYTFGLNWRAFVSWTMVVWPCLPGFAGAMSGADVSTSWRRVFQLSWVVGFCGGALVYYLISLISPPPGAPYVSELLHSDVIEASNGSDEEVGMSTELKDKK